MVKHRCGCAGTPEAKSAGCLVEWELPDDAQPDVFCGEAACPPCYEDIKRVLAALKKKGVTVAVDYGDTD